MGRETYLADLYRQSVQALTQNRTEWMGLLSSVSKYYKMSFDKNVLIYVQRPDAGLLATKMGWEKQTGRYLKAGSKGIGVVDMNNPKATLAYYFDLADTRGDYEGFRRAMSAVWSLERQYQPEILDRFHKQFGTDENSIENCLCQLVGMQADAFFEKYLSRVEVKDENRQSLQNLYQTVQLILFSRNAESRQRFLRRQRHLRISAILEVWNCSWDLGIIPAP